MSDDASSIESLTGGPAPGQSPSITAGVPSRMRPPPAPNELRVPPARLAKASSSSARGTPGGRPGRGVPDVGGRQGGRGSLLRTPLRTSLQPPAAPSTLKSPPESQQSESLLSDDDVLDSQGTGAIFDESQGGVAGVFTRMNQQLETQLNNLREDLKDTLSNAIGEVTATFSTALNSQTAAFTTSLTTLTARTMDLTSTLSDLRTGMTAQQSSITNLTTLYGKQSSAMDEMVKTLVNLNQQFARDVTPHGSPATATTVQDNVIPLEHDPTTAGHVETGNSPRADDRPGPDATDPAGALPTVDDATADATADSALANLARDQAYLDSQPGRANMAWRSVPQSTSDIPTPVVPTYAPTPAVTPSRPAPDHPRPRFGPQYGLGNPISTLTQTRMPDHMTPRPAFIDTNPNDDDPIVWKGGMIRSPRYIDRRKLVIDKNVHPTNIEALADVEYHGGRRGRATIDMPFVHSCGYRSSISDSDVVTAYGEIILLHTSTVERWENVRTQQYGPQLERIIEKGLATLPRLPGLTMEEIIDFYDKLQPVSALYLLPIVPFDCINVNMGYEALCPPGLGTHRYATIGRVLLEVLPRILPKLHSQVNTIITMVRQESNNGYDLLWRVLELGVPGFDPSVPIRVPVWKDDDIFDFAASFCLYYRLLAKKGMIYDDRSRSVTFLQAITAPAYIDAANTILINVHNYFGSDFDSTLPPALCIMGIANQLHEQSVKRAAAIVPRARRLAYDETPDEPPDPHSVSRMDGSRRWTDRAASGDRQQRGREDQHRQDRNGGGSTGRYGQVPPRPVVQGSRGPSRPNTSRGRYVRPDRNRGAYLPDTICDACRRPGHVAATCDVLAMALFIEKYKRDISGDLKDKIERDWTTRWKDTVGSNRSPRRVMKTYVDHLDISVDDLDDLLCWDCWPDDDPLLDEVGDGLAESA